jgi:formylglycine-generating enzyme required for sulfatase activity
MAGVDLKQMAFANGKARQISDQIDGLYQERDDLRTQGASPEAMQDLDSRIRALKREQRELQQSPQLQPEEWLADRYKLLERLGDGGFGVVWLAYDRERKQRVAVKLLHAQHADRSKQCELFYRGARALERLDHPNIVRILDRAQKEGRGYHYFAMELVVGKTLTAAVMEDTLTLQKRIEAVLQVGAALVYAHAEGIFHRDVNPNNILIGRTPGRTDEHALLGDFDLARLPDSSAGTGRMGTLAYLAPECWDSTRQASPRSEVYSLAMTAVFVYHGKALPDPWYLSANREQFFKDLACPPRVKRVLLRATNPEPDSRYPTMKDFCDAFQQTVVEGVSLHPEIVNSIGMKFVLIPAGTFLMGSPNEEEHHDNDEVPLHEVEITQPFYLGVYQVTQAQWRAVMGTDPSWFSATGGGKGAVSGMDTDDFPVEMVSWEDAAAVLDKLSARPEEKKNERKYRLATEAEWEYTCRGGASSSTLFHYGTSLSSTQANFDGNYPYGDADKGPYLKRPCAVASYQPNGFGLYDMHGNVWEWCADWYDKDYYKASPRRDPPGPSGGASRVLRGGSWISLGWDCRSADRYHDSPEARHRRIGFRVAAVLPGE